MLRALGLVVQTAEPLEPCAGGFSCSSLMQAGGRAAMVVNARTIEQLEGRGLLRRRRVRREAWLDQREITQTGRLIFERSGYVLRFRPKASVESILRELDAGGAILIDDAPTRSWLQPRFVVAIREGRNEEYRLKRGDVTALIRSGRLVRCASGATKPGERSAYTTPSGRAVQVSAATS